MVFNIKFTNAQTYAGKPTLKIGTLAAVSVDNGSAGMWGAGEVVCFVYDGTNFMATDTGVASTSGYGVTKLQDGTGSTATDLAATAKAVNTVHNEAVQVMTGATDQAAGTSGRVPAPTVGDKKKFLCGDGTWAEAEGGKLVVFELDTVTNSGGSYTHTTSIATVSHDMKAVLIETDDPSIFGATVHVTTADGAITLTCDEVNGTADVTVSCMFVANADPMTSSEFDVLSNRIGQLSALTTTDKSSVVNAINELNASMLKYYTFTATTDSIGFVVVPTAVCKPSTQHLISASMRGGGFALVRCFNNPDQYEIMLFDNVFHVYNSRTFEVSIAYTDI